MSTPLRTIRGFLKIGPKAYMNQLIGIGDTKVGTLVGTDRYGNKYYESKDELPLRTKWVDFKDYDYDASHIEPGWRNWLHYANDLPPGKEPALMHETRPWECKTHIPNITATRAAYKPYSTVKPKITEWEAVAKPRA